MFRYITFKNSKVPIYAWVDGIDIGNEALSQLENLSKMPFLFKHIPIMPDVHWGAGSTIGSVIPTKNVIIPAAVGVDIGCGMIAVKTNITASQLPDNLFPIRSDIESKIPHGRSDNGSLNDKGAFLENKIDEDRVKKYSSIIDSFIDISKKHSKISNIRNVKRHMGTLGSGNHFIEICIDTNDSVWIVIHSGSRGPGNVIGKYFIDKAKEEMMRYHILDSLPDKNLSYLVEKTEIFDDYVKAVSWAQSYASINRLCMLEDVIEVLKKHFPNIQLIEKAINCHHNYIEKENHFRDNVWVTRKGAIRARVGDLGIIPGSMGDKTYIVEGLGNRNSFCSCSHGAGRKMSRRKARETISIEEHKKRVSGIECRLDEHVLDESPDAYKDINVVMNAQKDLVKVKYILRQIINVKG